MVLNPESFALRSVESSTLKQLIQKRELSQGNGEKRETSGSTTDEGPLFV